MGQNNQIIDHEIDGVKSVTVIVGGTSETIKYGRSCFDNDRNGAIDEAYARAYEKENNK